MLRSTSALVQWSEVKVTGVTLLLNLFLIFAWGGLHTITKRDYFLTQITWETHGKGQDTKAVLSFFPPFFEAASDYKRCIPDSTYHEVSCTLQSPAHAKECCVHRWTMSAVSLELPVSN